MCSRYASKYVQPQATAMSDGDNSGDKVQARLRLSFAGGGVYSVKLALARLEGRKQASKQNQVHSIFTDLFFELWKLHPPPSLCSLRYQVLTVFGVPLGASGAEARANRGTRNGTQYFVPSLSSLFPHLMPHAHSSLVLAPVLSTVYPIGCGSGYCGLGPGCSRKSIYYQVMTSS